jgi:DNA-binding transcriptional LysR family regulator
LIYGRALLTRARAAFDELRQGVRDIEVLGDPTSGELRVGCVEAFSATIMRSLIQRFSRSYPHVTVHIDNVPPYPGGRLSGLRDRKHDLLFARWVTPQPQGHPEDDLNVEFLFDDPTVVAVGMQSPWARRRKIDLAELTEQTWILPPPGSPGHMDIAEAFGSRGLAMPKVAVMTTSVALRAQLIADGQYITTFNRSALLLNALPYALKILPVELPLSRRPVVFVTLKNRTLSPVVERFIEHVRDFAKTLARP